MTPNAWIDKYVLLQFKTSLREQQRELQETIDRVEKDIRDVADSLGDNMDLANCNSTRESMATRNTQNRRRLRMVELALDSIQDGSFGACMACGGAIGLKRLQAIPFASRCLECQERLEQGVLDVAARSIPALDGKFIQDSTS